MEQLEVLNVEALARPEFINRAGAAVALAEEIAPLAEGVAVELAREYGERAQGLTVESAETLEDASALLRELADLKKSIETARKALKDPVHQGGKNIDSIFAKLSGPVVDADQQVRRKVSAYMAEQERIRRQQEREALAEAERLRKLAAAEAAKEARKAGADKEEVAAVKAEAMAAPVAVALPATAAPKVAGVSGRKTWKAKVTNERKFVEACLAGTGGAGLFLLSINAAKLNALARTHDGNLAIPGVTVEEEHGLAVRS